MTPNQVKLGHAVTFYEILCQLNLFNISNENFNLE